MANKAQDGRCEWTENGRLLAFYSVISFWLLVCSKEQWFYHFPSHSQLVKKCNEGAHTMERTEQMYTLQKQLEFGKIKVCVCARPPARHSPTRLLYLAEKGQTFDHQWLFIALQHVHPEPPPGKPWWGYRCDFSPSVAFGGGGGRGPVRLVRPRDGEMPTAHLMPGQKFEPSIRGPYPTCSIHSLVCLAESKASYSSCRRARQLLFVTCSI